MLTLDRLLSAVRSDAAIRRTRRLQPVGGNGDKIFPPTYPGARNTDPARHVFEMRHVSGRQVLCVLIDSVQSQANRMEEALRVAREEGLFTFPTISVDFTKSDVPDIGHITALDAPHRAFDAIVRDSELDKKPFRESDEGKALLLSSSRNARGLFDVAPTSLVFGVWNSTGGGGGLGAKFPRCIVSEIVGVDVATEPDGRGEVKPSGKRTGSRVDPLGIRSGVKVFKGSDGEWSLKKSGSAKEVRPSEINHSNIAPSVEPLGVSVDHAIHSCVLSMSALRRLTFEAGPMQSEANVAGRAALAALGLAAITSNDRAGYFLRSRCELVPEEGQDDAFEWVSQSGAREPEKLTVDVASQLLKEAAEHAAKKGVKWRAKDVVLKPTEKLVQLVMQSRQLALQGAEENEG